MTVGNVLKSKDVVEGGTGELEKDKSKKTGGYAMSKILAVIGATEKKSGGFFARVLSENKDTVNMSMSFEDMVSDEARKYVNSKSENNSL